MKRWIRVIAVLVVGVFFFQQVGLANMEEMIGAPEVSPGASCVEVEESKEFAEGAVDAQKVILEVNGEVVPPDQLPLVPPEAEGLADRNPDNDSTRDSNDPVFNEDALDPPPEKSDPPEDKDSANDKKTDGENPGSEDPDENTGGSKQGERNVDNEDNESGEDDPKDIDNKNEADDDSEGGSSDADGVGDEGGTSAAAASGSGGTQLASSAAGGIAKAASTVNSAMDSILMTCHEISEAVRLYLEGAIEHQERSIEDIEGQLSTLDPSVGGNTDAKLYSKLWNEMMVMRLRLCQLLLALHGLG